MQPRPVTDPRRCTNPRCAAPDGWRPLADFYRNPRTGRYASWCRWCVNAQHLAVYVKRGAPTGERNGNCRFRGDLRALIRDSALGDTELARLLAQVLQRRVHRSTLRRIKAEARAYQPLAEVRLGPMLWLTEQLRRAQPERGFTQAFRDLPLDIDLTEEG